MDQSGFQLISKGPISIFFFLLARTKVDFHLAPQSCHNSKTYAAQDLNFVGAEIHQLSSLVLAKVGWVKLLISST